MLWNTSSPFIIEMPTGAAGLLSIQRAFPPHKEFFQAYVDLNNEGVTEKAGSWMGPEHDKALNGSTFCYVLAPEQADVDDPFWMELPVLNIIRPPSTAWEVSGRRVAI